jgi:hypothetical protein
MTDLYYWDQVSKGFYTPAVHGDKIPKNSIEVTEKQWKALLEENRNGKIITVEDGVVVAVDPLPAPAAELRDQCQIRAIALLAETDYTQYNDVSQVLANKADFDAYRAQLRKYVIRPIPNPVWPTKPRAVWKQE